MVCVRGSVLLLYSRYDIRSKCQQEEDVGATTGADVDVGASGCCCHEYSPITLHPLVRLLCVYAHSTKAGHSANETTVG